MQLGLPPAFIPRYMYVLTTTGQEIKKKGRKMHSLGLCNSSSQLSREDEEGGGTLRLNNK